MNGFKTPDPRMAAFITVVLLVLFAFSYIAPVLRVSWLVEDPNFSEALQQTLLTLLVFAVGYYLGSTRSSDDKNEIIATQARTVAATVAATPPALSGATPTGQPGDPVSVAVEPTKGTS